jgi:hypothetical protein
VTIHTAQSDFSIQATHAGCTVSHEKLIVLMSDFRELSQVWSIFQKIVFVFLVHGS